LKDARNEILVKLDAIFESVSMEKFIPDGYNPQETSIRNLKESDIIIFLISPYYGVLIDKCSLVKECKAECPMKTNKGRISYTHCEYKTAIAEKKHHQTYLIEDPYSLEFLEKNNQTNIGFIELKKIQYLKNLLTEFKSSNLEISKFSEFEKEISNEIFSIIRESEVKKVIELITHNLAGFIIQLYSDGQINFNQFIGRRKELSFLLENIDDKIEVYGVGGVGKTTLIQIALLLQKLKGRKILMIGIAKTYASGSDLRDFRIKCKEEQYITDSQKKITIYDIVNALLKIKILSNPEEIKKKSKNEIIEFLSTLIRNEENLILFIDDFQYADGNVQKLVMELDNVIIASRRRTHLAQKEIYLSGFGAEHKDVHADQHQVEDFYFRIIDEIFSTNKQALTLLKNISVLNTDLETNILRECAEKSFTTENFNKHFNELIDAGMLKRKEGNEGIYDFSFQHFQDALRIKADKESHEKALNYYYKKKECLNNNYRIENDLEVLFHKTRLNPNEELVKDFSEISKKLLPIHYKRLTEIGEELKNKVEDKFKISILFALGILYRNAKKFEETERYLQEASKIGKAMQEKDIEVPVITITQIFENLGRTYYNLKRFELAEQYLLNALKLWKILAENDLKEFLYSVASTQNTLGDLYFKLMRFEEAEITYKKALEIYKKLASEHSEDFLPGVILPYTGLASLYLKLGRYKDAKSSYEGLLEVTKKLAEKNPEAFLINVAETQSALGLIYNILGQLEEAEIVYQEAIDTFKELAAKNPEVDKTHIAKTQKTLGDIYRRLGRFGEAETTYKELLAIIIELAKKNPDAYMPDVASTQSNLGFLYSDLKRFEEAEMAFQKALEIYKALAAKNPEVYKTHIAETQKPLGVLYSELGRFEEAETAFQKVLEIYIALAKKNPDDYKPNVAEAQGYLGAFYSDINRFKEAETAYQESLEIIVELVEKNPDFYWPQEAMTLNQLGNMYSELKRFEEAESAFLESIMIYKDLAKKNPDLYKSNISETYNDLGILYSELKRFEEAETAYQEALEMYKELAEKNPDAYKPNVARTQYNLGILYSKLKRFEEAETAYQEALEIDPKDSNTWYNKACLESLRNSRIKAIEYLDKAIGLDKKYVEMAKSDKDFDNIRTSKEFKDIIGE
jgi:tetratricopeptide (TPR) repeat protein